MTKRKLMAYRREALKLNQQKLTLCTDRLTITQHLIVANNRILELTQKLFDQALLEETNQV